MDNVNMAITEKLDNVFKILDTIDHNVDKVQEIFSTIASITKSSESEVPAGRCSSLEPFCVTQKMGHTVMVAGNTIAGMENETAKEEDPDDSADGQPLRLSISAFSKENVSGFEERNTTEELKQPEKGLKLRPGCVQTAVNQVLLSPLNPQTLESSSAKDAYREPVLSNQNKDHRPKESASEENEYCVAPNEDFSDSFKTKLEAVSTEDSSDGKKIQDNFQGCLHSFLKEQGVTKETIETLIKSSIDDMTKAKTLLNETFAKNERLMPTLELKTKDIIDKLAYLKESLADLNTELTHELPLNTNHFKKQNAKLAQALNKLDDISKEMSSTNKFLYKNTCTFACQLTEFKNTTKALDKFLCNMNENLSERVGELEQIQERLMEYVDQCHSKEDKVVEVLSSFEEEMTSGLNRSRHLDTRFGEVQLTLKQFQETILKSVKQCHRQCHSREDKMAEALNRFENVITSEVDQARHVDTRFREVEQTFKQCQEMITATVEKCQSRVEKVEEALLRSEKERKSERSRTRNIDKRCNLECMLQQVLERSCSKEDKTAVNIVEKQ
ncbi:hypothetical protein BgiMline_036068 [Biomphalaria glabrata]|uniref:Uncharacterized protein LOC129921598 n=1 Tax=Biomphalaria glabrata TaxID=6526 RepID=A0A9W2ZCG3_BIOGL|nr:uncharacterized protein LOC129921598 [Biomphalaria glabrata]XP_055872736.1 uncharacterized protein LOC129921598 [Biomphalaria glabrata]KAI8751919.1 hypothetical protein BgiMline_014637 [Biomphalaria glabrata]